jgi:hypothetical protein
VGDVIVLLVGANSGPVHRVAFEEANGPIVLADPSRIESFVGRADALELEAGMSWVLFEELVGGASLALSIGGQCCQTTPDAAIWGNT